MPRTRSIAWSELKLGIVGIVALTLTGMIIVAVGGQGGFFWQRYPLKVRFSDVGGLKTGAVVRLSGKEVGKVVAVEFASSQIEVTVEVSKDVRSLVTTESEASLGSLSLLGEPIIDLKASNKGTPLADWAYLRAVQKPGFAELTDTANASLESAGQLIADIRSGRGTVGKLMTDQALYDEMHQLASSSAVVAGYLKDGKGTLGALVNDPSAYNELKAALEQLHTITQKIDAGQGPLARLLNDEAMGKSLASTSANLEQISGRINRGEGTAGKLLSDKELYDRFTNVATRLDQLVSGVENGQGTAGKLLKDQALYDNLNQTVTEMKTLIGEIRKDPRKYLNVRVSIF